MLTSKSKNRTGKPVAFNLLIIITLCRALTIQAWVALDVCK